MMSWVVQIAYGASLLVIIYFCVLAAARKDIWIGKTGAVFLGGIAASAVKMFELPMRNALVVMVVCMALLCILAYIRWLNHKHEFERGADE